MGTAAAQAIAPGGEPGTGITQAGMWRGYVRMDIPGSIPIDPLGVNPLPHEPPSRILFLDNCKPNGCAIIGGSEDSRSNHSRLVSSGVTKTLAAYTGSTTAWNQIVACVRATYAPFNIGVTDVDPCAGQGSGCTVSHWEAMVAGLPQNIGMSSGVAGVSPFTCGIIPNAITYSFANLDPSNVNDVCWTVAQESAHAFGLSHEILAADPMTYVSNPASKRFQNQVSCIGTGVPNPTQCCNGSECQCPGDNDTQNSFAAILAIFGTSTPTPPMVHITNPINGASVSPGFVVNVTVSDDNGIQKVELLIDNVVTSSLTSPPFAFNAPLTIAQGTHQVGVRATDTLGSAATDTISVNIGDPCHDNSACQGQGAGYVCVDGRCVPGPDNPGGLGTTCNAPADCASGQCVTGSAGAVCTESCNPASDACPDGFHCAKNGADPSMGFCYPGSTGGCLGCSTGGGSDPTLLLGIGVVGAAILVRRTRKRAA